MLPFPAHQLYSLTHVRYTPHLSWRETPLSPSPYDVIESYERVSKAQLMISDAKRYMPCLSGLTVRKSLFDIKTVLLMNEQDDGRPIMFNRTSKSSRVISVLGGKIDNIYDLFELVRQSAPEWHGANHRYLTSPVMV